MDGNSYEATRVAVEGTVMGAVPYIRGTRIPVVTLLAALADGLDPVRVLADFPQLEREDLNAALMYAASALGVAHDDAGPRWSRMLVGQLLDKLDTEGAVIGLMNRDGSARAFLLKATPDIVRLIEDLTMRADVPPAPEPMAKENDWT